MRRPPAPATEPVATKPEETIEDTEPTVEELFGDGSDGAVEELFDELIEEEHVPEGCVRNAAGDIIRLRDAGLQPVTSQE